MRADDWCAPSQSVRCRFAWAVQLLEPLRTDTPDSQQHLERIADVDAGIAEAVEHIISKLLAALYDSVGYLVDLFVPIESMQRPFELDQPVCEHMNIDDLIDIGNALRLGHGRGIDGMAGWPRLLSIDVDA